MTYQQTNRTWENHGHHCYNNSAICPCASPTITYKILLFQSKIQQEEHTVRSPKIVLRSSTGKVLRFIASATKTVVLHRFLSPAMRYYTIPFHSKTEHEKHRPRSPKNILRSATGKVLKFITAATKSVVFYRFLSPTMICCTIPFHSRSEQKKHTVRSPKIVPKPATGNTSII